MTTSGGTRRIAAVLVSALALCPSAGAEEGFPNRPIRLILGYTAGGPTDVACRLIAQQLGEQLGQPVVVENRAGAAGGIGMEMVARASPDGYTLAYGASSNVVILPSTKKKPTYHPVTDFTPVGATVTGALTLLVNNAVPAKNLREFVAYGRANSGRITMASPGIGSSPHLTGVLFNEIAGFQALHVPYQGGAQAAQATIAGTTHYVFDTLQTSVGFAKSDRVKVLAVTSAQRSDVLPDVPTVSESGMPSFTATIWHGLLAPKGTPPAVVARLNGALQKALQSKDFVDRLSALGLAPAPGTPEQFSSFMQSEMVKWKDVIARSGATID
jgi:tripartite-type tricarboxylate transporter receptor subunit TctC